MRDAITAFRNKECEVAGSSSGRRPDTQLDFALFATALIGTSMMPRLSRAFAHWRCARSRPAGPASRPRRRARAAPPGAPSAVDLGRGRHGIEHDVGLGEGDVVGAGDLAGDAARRGAVVE